MRKKGQNMVASSRLESLPCVLTPTEKQLKGDKLVKALEDKRKLEDEKKGVSERFKRLISGKEGEVELAAREISTGIEYRDVECKDVQVFARNQVDTVRLDTGEIVRSRVMQPNERQTAMEVGPGDEEQDDDEDAKSAH